MKKRKNKKEDTPKQIKELLYIEVVFKFPSQPQ